MGWVLSWVSWLYSSDYSGYASYSQKGRVPFEKLTNSLLLVDLLMLRTWISSIIRTQFPITHVSERDRCLLGNSRCN